MEGVIHWAGFLGAWLLVAGPLYQAALELDEDAEFAREVHEATKLPPEQRVSMWWWLLPPVYYMLRRRAARRQQRAVFLALDREGRIRSVNYVNKAGGWMAVAAGAFLIAVVETWELAETSHWPVLVFWVLIVVLAGASVVNAGIRIRRSHRVLDEYAAPDAGVASPEHPDSPGGGA